MAGGQTKKTVCIVGAGECGVAALKESVAAGLEPTLYDLDCDIGGMWHGKEPGKPTTTPTIWPSLVTNNSKYNVCYSDYPPDPRSPVFMSAQNALDYLKRVVKHFDLQKYIHLNTQVVKIRETSDHGVTGRWEVYTCPSGSRIPSDETSSVEDVLAKCHKNVFDNVIVCTGWFRKPNYPDIPGMDKFQGAISHSFNYSNPRHFDGKKVLVVGNRFSASEIACDVSSLAAETYLALGFGTWIIPRLCHGGRAFDLSVPRSMIFSWDPSKAIDDFLVKEATYKMDHIKSGVGPQQPPTKCNDICISDELPVKIASGRIKPYGHLAQLTERGAIFKDGKVIEELDNIIFCTGYQQDHSFLDFKFRDDNGVVQLYLMTMPLNRKHNTLALIGQYGTDGPLFVMAETQARLATAVMAGKQKLPSQKVMTNDVKMWAKISSTRKHGYRNFSVPGFALQDVIAMNAGFYPTFWKLLLRDPVLAWRTWNGPYLAAQYRLLGPDSNWEEAREICYRGYEEDLTCIRNVEAKSSGNTSENGHKRKAASVLFAFGFALGFIMVGIRHKVHFLKVDM